jgi:hypothetical protein
MGVLVYSRSIRGHGPNVCDYLVVPCVMMREGHVSPLAGATCHLDLENLDEGPRGK